MSSSTTLGRRETQGTHHQSLVDSAGPGVYVPAQGASEPTKQVGNPGERGIVSFLSGS
jgi:hypothetical protein